MAHEIDLSKGEAAVMSVGEAPWHRLGVSVAEAQTSAAAIKLARMDWAVEPWPLVARRDGVEHVVEGRVANVRADTGAVLGVVSTGYHVFQNRSAFDFFDHLVGEKLAMYETAGALRGGRIVWVLARLPKTIRVAGDDELRPYVLLCNSHDGSRALRMIPTSIRVVCMNTLNLAVGRAAATEGLTVYHSESLDARVADAREKLGVLTRRVDAFEAETQALAARSLTRAELVGYFAGLVERRPEESQKKLIGTWVDNLDHETNTLAGIAGSAWAAYNAVSLWADHQSGVRGRSAAQKADSRLYGVWFGAAAELKQKAFAAALALAA